jgi:tRNA pseudouridine55 synthase
MTDDARDDRIAAVEIDQRPAGEGGRHAGGEGSSNPGGEGGRHPGGGKKGRRPPFRKVPKNDINGWLILDKPEGLTSTEALGAVKRVLRPAKAGHAGTLDPLATGILPIALGEATKTVPSVVDGRKVYRFTLRWGQRTDTDDAEGEVVAVSDVRPTPEEVRAVLCEFTGAIMQVPPRYSAVKIKGERAYDLARDGQVVELEARPVEVHRLAVVEAPDVDHIVLEAECGKGTYVRSLARDLGERLGTEAHVTALRRTVVGPFDEEDAFEIAELEEARAEGLDAVLDLALLPVSEAVVDLPFVDVERPQASRLRRGQSVFLRPLQQPPAGPAPLVAAISAGDLVALCTIEGGELQPTRVFKPARRPRHAEPSLAADGEAADGRHAGAGAGGGGDRLPDA